MLAIVLFVLPSRVGADWVKTFTSVAIYSVVALGLGVLYGRVGMISLGQIALLAIGTWTATRLNFATTLPFPVLLLVTGAITCAVGVLVGLPALRLSGLYLALITLMGAGAVNVVLSAINFPNGGSGFTGRHVRVDLSGLAPVRRPGDRRGRHRVLPLRGRRLCADVPACARARRRQARAARGRRSARASRPRWRRA